MCLVTSVSRNPLVMRHRGYETRGSAEMMDRLRNVHERSALHSLSGHAVVARGGDPHVGSDDHSPARLGVTQRREVVRMDMPPQHVVSSRGKLVA